MFSKIWQQIIDWFVQPFPSHYPPECFDCDEGSCDGCETYRQWKD